MNPNKQNRLCPVCGRTTLQEMDHSPYKDKRDGVTYRVYRCTNDGSEIWIHPFKYPFEG